MVWWWAREAADAMAFFFLFLQCNQKNAANRCYLVFVSIFSGSNLVFYSISLQPSLCEAVWTRPQSSPLFGKQNKWKKTHVQQVREKIMALDENAVFTATLRSDTDLITQWLALNSQPATKILTMDNSFQVQCFYPAPNVQIVAALKITCNTTDMLVVRAPCTMQCSMSEPSSL